MMKTADKPVRRSARPFLQPLAIALLCLIFSSLFFSMAVLDIKRIRGALMAALENKGMFIIEGVRSVAADRFNHLTATGAISPVAFDHLVTTDSTRELLVNRLIDLAGEIDRRAADNDMTQKKLRRIPDTETLRGIILLDAAGKAVFVSGMVPKRLVSQARSFHLDSEHIGIDLHEIEIADNGFGWIGIKRKIAPGAILLVLDRIGFKYWAARAAVQEAVSEVGWRHGVLNFLVKDHRGRPLVKAGEFLEDAWDRFSIGETKPEAIDARRILSPRFRNVFKVSAPLRFGEKITWTATVGLATDPVNGLIEKNRKHVFLSMGLIIGIGLVSIWLLYRTQNRHIRKLQAIDEQLHQAERLSSLGQLAAGVAHEIRNPLNAIGMAAQRIRRECDLADNKRNNDLRQLTGVIRDEIRRLNGIVEDFLGLSRNRFTLQSRSIVELLERLIHLIRDEADSREIRIETRWEDAAPIVQMDADKMKQAFLNIIKNALESMAGPGTIGFRVGVAAKKYVSVGISDTGSGIPADRVKQIFNPHFTTKDKGLGLGLSIAYEIIRAHGGKIQVYSRPGKGTVFEILLPRERKPHEGS